MEVKGDGVEAQRLDLLEDIDPQRGDGQTVGMKFSRVDKQTFSVNEEGIIVKRHDILEQFTSLRVEDLTRPTAEGMATLDREGGEGEEVGEPHIEGGKTDLIFFLVLFFPQTGQSRVSVSRTRLQETFDNI